MQKIRSNIEEGSAKEETYKKSPSISDRQTLDTQQQQAAMDEDVGGFDEDEEPSGRSLGQGARSDVPSALISGQD